jgi:hypothetical protein
MYAPCARWHTANQPNVFGLQHGIKVEIRLHQDLERIANLLGVGELFGARLKILKRLYPLEEPSSDKGRCFLVF